MTFLPLLQVRGGMCGIVAVCATRVWIFAIVAMGYLLPIAGIAY